MKEKVPKYRKNAYRTRIWKFTVEYFWTLYCRFLFIIPWTLQRYEPGRAIATSRAFSRNLLCPFRSVMITKISVFLQAIFKQISINPFTFRWIASKGDQRYFSGIGKGGIFFDNRRTYCLDPEVLTTLSPKVKKNDDKSLQSGHGIRTLICRPEMGAQQHSCSRQPTILSEPRFFIDFTGRNCHTGPLQNGEPFLIILLSGPERTEINWKNLYFFEKPQFLCNYSHEF